ncbi:MAG: hypothetical protein J6Y71_03740 [Ruminococcus sp.]|nr:hypothetical protein [Ruminococcus sp.]
MLNGLTLIATLGSLFLFLCALSEAIDLEEQKSQEKREEIRKAVYAAKRQQWIKKKNRRELWQEVAGYENYLD